MSENGAVASSFQVRCIEILSSKDRIFKMHKFLRLCVILIALTLRGTFIDDTAVRGTLITDAERLLHVNLLFFHLAGNALHFLVNTLSIPDDYELLIFLHFFS